MNLILAFLLSAIAAYGEISFGTASRIRRGAGAPSSGDCAASNDVGKVYIQNDLAASGSPIFACSQSGASSYSWQQASGGGGGGGGATTALDNLASVSINAALIPQSAKALGAAATPWQTLCLYGSGTFGSHSWCTAGTPTGNRTLTLPDASITVAGSASALTSTRVPFATTGGLLTDSAGLTFTDAANVRLATLAGGSSQSTAALLDITNSAGTSHWLTVLGNGNMGIGTNAPSTNLEVRNAGAVSLRLNNSSSGTTIDINSDAGGVPRILVPASNGLRFDFGTGATRMFIGASVGIGTSNTTPTGTLSILDATPSTGSTAMWIGHDGSGTYSGVHLSALTTSLNIVAGLTQSTANLLSVKNAAGTSLFNITESASANGAFTLLNAGNARISLAANGGVVQGSGMIVGWDSGATITGAIDTSLSRIGAGIVGVGTGAAGSVGGDLAASGVRVNYVKDAAATNRIDLSSGGLVAITAGHALSVLSNGAASVSNILGSGTWFTGGSATTTKPYLLIEPSGTTSNGWSTSGTGIGVNAASGFAGNLLDLQVAGVRQLSVGAGGDVAATGGIVSAKQLQLSSAYTLSFSSKARLYSPADGVLLLWNTSQTSFDRLQFGGTTNLFPSWQRSTTGLVARLADDSADTWVQASYLKITSTAESTCSSTTRGEIRMVQGSTGVADTFRICGKDSSDSYAWRSIY